MFCTKRIYLSVSFLLKKQLRSSDIYSDPRVMSVRSSAHSPFIIRTAKVWNLRPDGQNTDVFPHTFNLSAFETRVKLNRTLLSVSPERLMRFNNNSQLSIQPTYASMYFQQQILIEDMDINFNGQTTDKRKQYIIKAVSFHWIDLICRFSIG